MFPDLALLGVGVAITNSFSNTAEIPEISTPARAFELRGSQYDWGYK
jgi:choline dehydrogenase